MDQYDNKTVIVGAGAMGCFFAAELANSGREVWLLDKNKDRAELIAEQGVIVELKKAVRGLSPDYSGVIPPAA